LIVNKKEGEKDESTLKDKFIKLDKIRNEEFENVF
jgi:hypothetical protein